MTTAIIIAGGSGHRMGQDIPKQFITGYCYAPIIDALTDDRQHIKMRGRRYTAPPLTSTCSVVCQSYKTIITGDR